MQPVVQSHMQFGRRSSSGGPGDDEAGRAAVFYHSVDGIRTASGASRV